MGLSASVCFWEKDVDFPEKLMFYWDRNILLYMHYETVWFAASSIVRELKERMTNS